MNPIEQLRQKLPLSIQRLADLAYNYWWSWTSDRLSLFRDIYPEVWESTNRNPVAVLNSVDPVRLSQLASDPIYIQRVKHMAEKFDSYMQETDTWAARVAPHITRDRPIIYFSAEFGIHESLPIYSGGLGILAGDHLKSASDLGLPIVGVGLLYRQGYFHQRINRHGWQEDYYIDSNFDEMPLQLMVDGNGDPITITLSIRERPVNIQIWKAMVGRTVLYLLDTDREDNDPIDRWLTGHLYGGNKDTRIAQEMLLGIGGVRALKALGVQPSLYHLNEGHAAFCTLEIAREQMQQTSRSFHEVEPQVRERCVFTTHTPVPAGHDSFTADLMDSSFAEYWRELGLTRHQFLTLGARRLGDPWEPFNMTVLALRMCRTANGVSRLHGQVSRQMWQILYPDCQEDEVPIGHITNGVHVRSWTAPLMADLYNQYLGEDWSHRVSDAQVWSQIDRVPDGELWWRHQILKNRLVNHARSQAKKARENRGGDISEIEACDRLLDPDVLTIGFARRFSLYKRAYLLLQDPERMVRILANPERPVQLVFAGKAHPADEQGKRVLQRLFEWREKHPEVRDRVAFLEDYDIHTAQKLVQGVDVWLNTPRRPLEASGTSGQKVCLNGGLNFSILDGWWCEGYQESPNGKGINGWAIGKDAEAEDQNQQDRWDAESLYHLLESEIVPLYYDRDRTGLSPGWCAMMKASIKTNAPVFNTDRMISEYVTKVYAPEAKVTAEPVFAEAIA
ncbi:alpha-glucan family phosphorylase [Geitlerinema sp. PCC 9228]|jgi:starch phosphorylase|uniref:alpha-glucan family phosphorylase n=1 Tax=Geitlerinema sp. PCC 9228 TaxID=111611 RepID=UPI0008F9C4AB|nr:alpha-glucan family phosphorylase [Geitlerinema sp. PCC 9228]